MKKILKLLLAIIMFVPFIAKADMGAPTVRSYKAVVIKAEGITKYDDDLSKDGTLAKDSVVEVEYEIKEKGVVYLSVTMEDDEDYNYFFVKAEDVVPLEKEVDPGDKMVDKLEKSTEFKVFAKDGVDVRKGPSASYEKVGHLDQGTTGKYRYFIDESSYIYVDVAGVTGWVDQIDAAVLTKGGPVILAEIQNGGDACGNIPANTTFDEIWYSIAWDGVAIADYNGCQAELSWFKNEDMVTLLSEPDVEKTLKEVKLYQTPTSKKVLGSIPKGEKATFISDIHYEFDMGPGDMYIYAEYKGVKGWAPYKSEYFKSAEEYEEDWDDDEDEEEPEIEDEDPVMPYEEPEEEEELEEEEEEVTEKKHRREEEDEDDEEDSGLDSRDIVIMCCIGAGTFLIGGAITIIFVNRKKKVKAPVEVAPVVAPIPAAPVEEVPVHVDPIQPSVAKEEVAVATEPLQETPKKGKKKNK